MELVSLFLRLLDPIDIVGHLTIPLFLEPVGLSVGLESGLKGLPDVEADKVLLLALLVCGHFVLGHFLFPFWNRLGYRLQTILDPSHTRVVVFVADLGRWAPLPASVVAVQSRLRVEMRPSRVEHCHGPVAGAEGGVGGGDEVRVLGAVARVSARRVRLRVGKQEPDILLTHPKCISRYKMQAAKLRRKLKTQRQPLVQLYTQQIFSRFPYTKNPFKQTNFKEDFRLRPQQPKRSLQLQEQKSRCQSVCSSNQPQVRVNSSLIFNNAYSNSVSHRYRLLRSKQLQDQRVVQKENKGRRKRQQRSRQEEYWGCTMEGWSTEDPLPINLR